MAGAIGSQFGGSGLGGLLLLVFYVVFGPLFLIVGIIALARGVPPGDDLRFWVPWSFGLTALPFVTSWFGPIGWAGLLVAVLVLLAALRGR